MSENIKPSGIIWIGDVPESWSIQPLKYITDCNQKVISESTPPTFTFRYIDIGSVTFEDGIGELEELIFEDAPSRARRIVTVGDTIISTVRTYLKAIAYVENSENIIASTGFAVYTPGKKLFPKYLYYFCISEGFVQEVDKFSYGIAYPAINTEILSKIAIVYPELSEQTFVVDFLDGQCERIDSIVTDLEKQIEILQKYKKSLITETVTKGLDKTAHMKESGIDAIGLIKESYVISKLKYIVVTPISDGPHETPILLDEGVPFLSAEAVRNERLEFENKRGYISEADHEMYCKKCKPQRNDIFMIKSGATTGNIALVDTDEEFSVWSPLALIRCDNIQIKQKFIFYSMLSNYFIKNVELSWSYGTQQNIGMGVIGNLQVVLPSSNEQIQIVNYLDQQCSKIESIIESKKEQLTKITQHKKSLIYEYVTGKKRVKGEHSNGN